MHTKKFSIKFIILPVLLGIIFISPIKKIDTDRKNIAETSMVCVTITQQINTLLHYKQKLLVIFYQKILYQFFFYQPKENCNIIRAGPRF